MRLAGCEIQSIAPILKIEMLTFQSKTSLHEKILFGKITHYLDPEIRKMLIKGMFWNKHSTLHFGPVITCKNLQNLHDLQNFISETDNVDFNVI